MNLKQQAINGVLWNSIGRFSGMGIEFVVGIILARLLTPKEFGLIGTIMVVISLSQVFINSGFNQALIRKQNCTQQDYSTVFFFNLITGLVLFVILFISSGYISRFYKNPELKPLIQVLGTGIIMGSLTLIQSTRLTKRIDFRLQTKISVTSSLISGIIAVAMAIKGFGVWSLVVKSLLNQAINSALLWLWNRWKPDIIFSLASFRELFSFGSKLLLSGLIGTFFNNIYYIVIGKYFSAGDLGYYTRAELFKNLTSQNITDISNSVAYPILSKLQNDPVGLKEGFRKILTTTFFVVAILMFGLASIAPSLVITLVGEQWDQSIIYLQMLCFVGLMYPLNSININFLNVVGRSDLYLKLQFINQLCTVPIVIAGAIFGMKTMIIGICINSLLAFFYFSIVSARFSGYAVLSQLKDLKVTFLLSLFMGIFVMMADILTIFKPIVTLLLQVGIGALIVFFFCEVYSIKEYILLKKIFLDQIKK
jgi:O-antigen/teichoic acid export membrane protein